MHYTDDKNTTRVISGDFQARFGGNPSHVLAAPGRVNLMGEHTDYNGGFVLPFAVDRRISMAAREESGVSVIHAQDKGESLEFDARHLPPPRPGHWSNYPLGVMAEFSRMGHALPQLALIFSGDIPAGGGLSSSAALAAATALLLDRMLAAGLARERLALIAQAAEHGYAGVRCGIMDQYATLLARRGHALFLDCRSGEYLQAPLRLGDCRLAICNSMVKHELANSGYNDRRRECESALAKLRRLFPDMADLRDGSLERLRAAATVLTDVEYRRALHQVEENARVQAAVRALADEDVATLGSLMYGSHRSLRENFDVTSPETDFLVEEASGFQGVLGARMTGGGFGGNVIVLVRQDQEAAFVSSLRKAYRSRFGIECDVFMCQSADGAAFAGE